MTTIWHWFSGLFNAVKNDALSAVHYVYAFLQVIVSTFETVFTGVHSAWSSLYASIGVFVADIEQVGIAAYRGLRWLKVAIVDPIYEWAKASFLDVYHGLVLAEQALETARTYLEGLINSGIAYAERWSTDHIFTPLDARLRVFAGWVTNHAAAAVDLIEHPDRLAAIMLAPLYKAGLALLTGSEYRIAHWMRAGILQTIVWSVGFFEDVLAKVV